MNEGLLQGLLIVMVLNLLILGGAVAFAFVRMGKLFTLMEGMLKATQEETTATLKRVRAATDTLEAVVADVQPAIASVRKIAEDVGSVTGTVRRASDSVGKVVGTVESLANPGQLVGALVSGKGIKGNQRTALAISLGAGLVTVLASRMRKSASERNGHQ